MTNEEIVSIAALVLAVDSEKKPVILDEVLKRTEVAREYIALSLARNILIGKTYSSPSKDPAVLARAKEVAEYLGARYEPTRIIVTGDPIDTLMFYPPEIS